MRYLHATVRDHEVQALLDAHSHPDWGWRLSALSGEGRVNVVLERERHGEAEDAREALVAAPSVVTVVLDAARRARRSGTREEYEVVLDAARDLRSFLAVLLPGFVLDESLRPVPREERVWLEELRAAYRGTTTIPRSEAVELATSLGGTAAVFALVRSGRLDVVAREIVAADDAPESDRRGPYPV